MFPPPKGVCAQRARLHLNGTFPAHQCVDLLRQIPALAGPRALRCQPVRKERAVYNCILVYDVLKRRCARALE